MAQAKKEKTLRPKARVEKIPLPEPAKDGRLYEQKIEIFAIRMDRPFKFRSRHGVHQGVAGDYLCQNKAGEKWAVHAALFHETFRPAWECLCFSECKCGKRPWPPGSAQQ